MAAFPPSDLTTWSWKTARTKSIEEPQRYSWRGSDITDSHLGHWQIHWTSWECPRQVDLSGFISHQGRRNVLSQLSLAYSYTIATSALQRVGVLCWAMAGAKDQTRAARVCVRLFLADASKGTHLLQQHATPMSLFHWYRRTGIMTGNVEASCSATACQQVWFGHGSFHTSNIFTLHSCLPFKAYKAVSSGPARNKAILGFVLLERKCFW